MSTGVAVLVVEDEEPVRRAIVRTLTKHGYICESAGSVAEAGRLLRSRPFALVLCDVHMPGGSGIELARSIARDRPSTAVVMVTGETDPATASTALAIGAFGYVVKPFTPDEIVINVMNALRRRDLEIENNAYRENLERTVTDRTRALRSALERVVGSQQATIHRLAKALEFRDVETVRHTERVSAYAGLLGERVGSSPDEVRLTATASVLHDVGKIGVPDAILHKPGTFTAEDRRVMERHPELGSRILADSEGEELLGRAATIALTHHERWDGTGYPGGLSGEAIPLPGRIAMIADVFDAVSTDRVYRPAMAMDKVVDLMRSERGRLFDPSLLDAFLEDFDRVLDIRSRFPDVPAPLVPAH